MKTNSTRKKFIFLTAFLFVLIAAFTVTAREPRENETASAANWLDKRASSFAGGSGTQASPYQISAPEQLAYLAYVTANDMIDERDGAAFRANGKYYELTADINLNPSTSANWQNWADSTAGLDTWQMIGTRVGLVTRNFFAGNFDGKGHTVKGVYIPGGSSAAVGVFGHVGAGGVVANLHVRESYMRSTYDCIGGIAGYVTGGAIINCSYGGRIISNGSARVVPAGGIIGSGDNLCRITDCYVTNTGWITCFGTYALSYGTPLYYDYVGGIAGECNGAIKNCRNSAKIDGKNNIGGIVGCLGFNQGVVTDCYNEGNIIVTGGTQGNSIGGIVGANNGDAVIMNCYNTGNLSADSYNSNTSANYTQSVGGILGSTAVGNATIWDCYNTGNISASATSSGGFAGNGVSVGGIAGSHGTGAVTNCYNSGNITGGTCGGINGRTIAAGIAAYTGGVIKNCYSTGSITGGTAGGGFSGPLTSGIVGRLYAGGGIINCYNSGSVSGINANGVPSVSGIVAENSGTVSYSYYQAGKITIGGALQSSAEEKGVLSSVEDVPKFAANGVLTPAASGYKSNALLRGALNEYANENSIDGLYTFKARAAESDLIWEKMVYTITYAAGDYGSGAVALGTKTKDVPFTLSSSRFLREGYVQTGWSALPDGAVKAYNMGGAYSVNKGVTFYPYWDKGAAVTVSLAGWIYGGAPNSPVLSDDRSEEQLKGSAIIEYQLNGAGAWTTAIPENAGTHKVRASWAATANYQAFTTPEVSFTIIKANNPTAITVSLAGWAKGETPKDPLISGSPSNSEQTVVIYEYQEDGAGAWTTVKPENAGTHKVRAKWEASANYNEYITAEAGFTIAKMNGDPVLPVLAGWTYGETPGNPSVSARSSQQAASESVDGGADGGVIFEYQLNGAGAWTTAQPLAAGTHKVRARWLESADYQAYTSDGVSFTIGKAEGSAVTVSLDGWIYGAPKEPSASGNPSGEQIQANAIYEYRLNGSGSWTTVKPLAAGTHKVRARWLESANYQAYTTPEKSFTITKATVAPGSVTVGIDGWTYNGAASNPVLSGNPSAEQTSANVIYEYRLNGSGSWTTTKPAPAGEYEVRARWAASDNYNACETAPAGFTIGRANGAAAVAASLADWTYGGVEKEPQISGGRSPEQTPANVGYEYQEDCAGAWTTAKPVNAGTHKVRAFWRESANYLEYTTAEISFTIAKAHGSGSVIFKGAWVYASIPDIEISSATGQSWSQPKYVERGTETEVPDITAVFAGEYTLIVVFDANQNYTGLTVTVDFKVNRAGGSGTVTIENWTYGDSPNVPVLSSVTHDVLTDSHTITYVGRDGTVYDDTAAPENAGKYTVKVVFAANVNFEGFTDEEDFEILKADGAAAGDITAGITGWTYGGTAGSPFVSGNPPNGEQTVVIYEYQADGTGAWTTTPPLAAGTHKVRARWEESDNYNEYVTAPVEFIIAKADIAGGAVTAGIPGWTYGGAAGSPFVSGSPSAEHTVSESVDGGIDGGVIYEYQKDGTGEWTTVKPLTAGTHKVRAFWRESADYNEYTTEPFEFIIAKADGTPGAVTVSLEEWTYGGAANDPGISDDPTTEQTEDNVIYEYQAAGAAGWTTVKPSAAGTHKVRARWTESDNYNEYTTAPAEFIINKAAGTLDADYTIAEMNYSGEYDAQQHSASVKVMVQDGSGYNAYYSLDGVTYYLTSAPKYADICEKTVYYRVVFDNYIDVYGTLAVKIYPAIFNVQINDGSPRGSDYATGLPVLLWLQPKGAGWRYDGFQAVGLTFTLKSEIETVLPDGRVRFDFTMPYNNVVITAIFTQLESFTVEFDMSGGAGYILPQIVCDGGFAAYVQPPIRGGYTFIGWFKDGDFEGAAWNFSEHEVKGGMTLTAKWLATAFNVRMEDGSPRDLVYLVGGPVLLWLQPMDGWLYAGDFTVAGVAKADVNVTAYQDGRVSFTFTMPAADVTVTAGFVKAEVYEVVFKTAEGEAALSAQVIYEKGKISYIAPPKREGYIFTGWYNGDEEWDFETGVITSDVTLTAHWQALGETVDSRTNKKAYIWGLSLMGAVIGFLVAALVTGAARKNREPEGNKDEEPRKDGDKNV